MEGKVLLDSHTADSVETATLGFLKASHGSGKWTTHADSKQDQPCTVISSVNGPIEVRLRDETVGKATLEFQLHPASGLGSPRERFIEELVVRAISPILLLGLHPRSQLVIVSQIVAPVVSHLESQMHLDNEMALQAERVRKDQTHLLVLISTIINSISTALLDSNYTTDAVLAATVIDVPHESGNSSALLVYSFPKEELILIETAGSISRSSLPSLAVEGLKSALIAYTTLRTTIEEKMHRDNSWRE